MPKKHIRIYKKILYLNLKILDNNFLEILNQFRY